MFNPHYLLSWLLIATGLLPGRAVAQTISYAAPLVITKGGTYSGNYQSLDSNVPCILVNTTAPVVLQGCRLAGAGHLIQSGTGANLTIRDCTGTGLTPSVDGRPPGHFLGSYQSQSLVVEHNSFSGTSGIVVDRWAGNSGTLTVRYNQARNVDGRWRNNGGSSLCSFLQLNTVTNLPGVEIAFNEVINTPNQSLVEDNINFYNSSGTAGSPMRVHDNFVRGAYPYPATSGTYTGSGLTTDGDASALGTAAGYIEASANQFVSTCNAGMNIAAGHDINYHDNRLVSSGLLPDGTRLRTTYAGTAVFNYYNQPAGVFFNNRSVNNTIGYVRWGSSSPYPNRQDLSPGNCATCTGTINLPNPVTLASEDNEYAFWQQKLAQNGVVLGPLGAVAKPVPTPTFSSSTSPSTIANAGFEADNAAVGAPSGWATTPGAGTDDNADYTESYGGAHAGSYHGTHYRPEAYKVYTYQVVKGLPNGIYTLSAWVKSSGGQNTAQLQAKNYGGADVATAIGASPGAWAQVIVKNISVTNGQCEIGIYSKASAGNWLHFDDFALVAAVANKPLTVALKASPATLTLGQAATLSATADGGTVVKVDFFNGSTKLGTATAAPYQLSWTPPAAGSYALTAVATDEAGAGTTSAAASLTVAAAPVAARPAPTGSNLVANPGFEADGRPTNAPAAWQITAGPGAGDHASYTETYAGAHSGTYHGTHYQPLGYEVYTYQIISNLPNGTYRLRAWVRGGGWQRTAQMQVRNYGGPQLATTIGDSGSDWAQVELANIRVTSGTAEIGFYSQAAAGQWIYFDDVELVAQLAAAAPTAATLAGNPVRNASFDDDQAAVRKPSGWVTTPGPGTNDNASYTESYGNSRTGSYHGTHYRPEAYEVTTSQLVTGLPNGTYTLSAWVKSSGGQRVAQLQARNYGGSPRTAAAPATPDGQWALVTISNILVANGQCEVGFYSNAPGGQWLYYEDVALTPLGAGDGNLADNPASAVAPIPTPALFPNPADNQTTVSLTLPGSQTVTLTVYDKQGRQLAQYQRAAVAGDNQFSLDTSALPSGLYTLRVASSQPTQVLRLEVQH